MLLQRRRKKRLRPLPYYDDLKRVRLENQDMSPFSTSFLSREKTLHNILSISASFAK